MWCLVKVLQTIPNIGIYLPEPVFSHEQLYIVLSRATVRNNVKILAISVDEKKRSNDKKKISITSDKKT
uniref:Uncharacterized protein n=1 Tax=Arundo donax TaxID=35708 RepID=A0A0A9EQC0_ARUDO